MRNVRAFWKHNIIQKCLGPQASVADLSSLSVCHVDYVGACNRWRFRTFITSIWSLISEQMLYINAKKHYPHKENKHSRFFIRYKPIHLHHIVLRSSQDVYERFGVIAIIVLPNVGDCGEGWRGRWGQNGRHRMRLRGLENLLLHITFCLGAREKDDKGTAVRQNWTHTSFLLSRCYTARHKETLVYLTRHLIFTEP